MRSSLFWALVALALVLVAMETARPRYFLHDDNASWFAGAYLHDYRVLAESGQLAEVNYFQHGGEPFLQQGQTAVLFPPIYIGVALAKFVTGDAIWAVDWIAAIHLGLGLAGFYFWMRQSGIAPRFAALGGLAWMLNPFVLIIGASWIFTIIVAAWLPWLFWAFDRLVARHSARNALYIGGIAGLLFLQGYVQYFVYALSFLGLYALFQILTRPEARRPAVLYYLFVAALIGAIFSLPLLLPMLHAMAGSAFRADALPVDEALDYSVAPGSILPAQFCFFGFNLVMGTSVAALYCPALLLLPATIIRLFFTDAKTRRTLIAFVLLGLVALLFSTGAHAMLTMLPLFNKFRWPFKVFLFADFFFLAALVWTAAAWTGSRFISARVANLTAIAGLIVVVLANLSLSFAFREQNFISEVVLPTAASPMPSSMDSRLGRAVTFSDGLLDDQAWHFLSHAYATFYAFPSLGGYDPLVGQAQIEYSLYLDYPNFCRGTMTPDFQKDFENRAVRYWIVDASSSQLAEIASLPGLQLIDRNDTRVIFEDTHAVPIAHAAATPSIALPVTYSGNFMRIPLHEIHSPLFVSAGPTDGWWYRADGGPWVRPSYRNGWLILQPSPSAQLVEITYFDARFREGLLLSAILLVVALILIAVPTKFRAW